MRVVIVGHHERTRPGSSRRLRGARRAAEHDPVPQGGPAAELGGLAHIVLLGSTSSVYDEGGARAWIDEELAWLRRADAAGVARAWDLFRRAGAGWPRSAARWSRRAGRRSAGSWSTPRIRS